MRKAPVTVSVILSFFNEESVIPEMIARQRAVFAALRESGKVSSYEIIFIDDRSTDASVPLIRKYIQEATFAGEIKLVRMSRNFGVSPCVQAGLPLASGDVVIYMDADLQDPPEEIPKLLEAYLADPDVEVIHTVRKHREGESAFKLGITALGYRILRMVSTVNLAIEAGDFKLLSRRVVDELKRLKELNPYMRGLVAWVGFKQATVEYHRQARFAGLTKFPILSSKVIRNFFTSALIGFSDVPLTATSIFGLAMSSFSFLAAFVAAVAAIFGVQIHEILWLGIWLTFLSGLNFLGLGVLGLYVASIHKESRGRPPYIIESLEGFVEKAEDQKFSAFNS